MTAVLPVRAPGAVTALPPGHPVKIATGMPPEPAHVAAGVVRWSGRLLLAVTLAAFAVLGIGPHAFGYRTMTMLTGSMSPQIDPGDVVVSTPLDVHDVAVGMVISYHIPIDDHRVVTHRVVSVEQGADGTVTVQTKGDANSAVDPWTATLRGDTAYQVRAVVPAIGSVIQWLRTPELQQGLMYGAPALLAGWLILSTWRPEREDDEDPA